MADSIHTYTGVWINWTDGLIRGATLTLSEKHAGLLSSFLAIFVSFAGSLFWSIISFAIHQSYTTEPSQRQDALHYQRQIILRNKGAASASWAFLKLPFEDGRTGSKARAVARSLPFAIVGLLNILLFGVSSLFTSYITKSAGSLTLLVGPGCGGFQFSASDPSVLASKTLQDTYDAATYVRQCYQGNPDALSCGTYVRSSLPFTTNANASCPFAAELCAYNNQSAFQMDTGFLDSHLDFGINAPKKDRVKFRRVTTCAPVAHGSLPGVTQNDSVSDGDVVSVYAGPQYYLGDIFDNATFSFTPIANLDAVGYTLSALHALFDPTGILQNSREWAPDASINQTNADITMMMLNQNDMTYTEPSYDPWMTALIDQNATVQGTTANYTFNLWTKSYLTNFLVCVDQYQVCNPNRPDETCSTLGGLMSVAESAFSSTAGTGTSSLGMNAAQISTSSRLISDNTDRSMYSNVNGRGGAALNASMMAYNNQQFHLPPTQWQVEVSIWFATSLAKDQAWAVEWATAPRNLPTGSLGQADGWNVTTPTDPVLLSQCRNQLVNNAAGYENFSVLGLALTLIVCGLIIFVGLGVDTVVGWLRRGEGRYKREQWAVEETLALHKAAYANLGGWREDGEMVSSSVLLRSNAVAVAVQEGDDSMVRKHGYTVVGNEVQ